MLTSQWNMCVKLLFQIILAVLCCDCNMSHKPVAIGLELVATADLLKI